MMPSTSGRQSVALIAIVAVVVVAMAGIVAADAKRSVARHHGLGGFGWFVVCLLFGPFGVVGYLLSERRRERLRSIRDAELERQGGRADWEGLVQRENGNWPAEPPPS